jgi:hypothetical protein
MTLPDFPSSPATTITVASPNDLLWGKAVEYVDETNNEVTITMKHKFAEVRVMARMAGADIIDMHDVTVAPGNSADLTVETGGLAKNGAAAAVAVPVSWGGGEWVADEEVTSDPAVIYIGTKPFYVDIGTVEIEGYPAPFTNARAVFNKELEEGKSYTLVISFKQTLWAKSNIYWKWKDDSDHDKGGYLTFDTYENSHQGYQGVFFKWGSLVGISAARVGGSDDFLGQDVPIYVPAYNGGAPKSSTWEATTSTAKGWDSWGDNISGPSDIPYMDPSDYVADNYARDNNYVMHPDRNKYEVYKDGRGDICQYLSTKTGVVEGNWRLPTAGELGPAGGWTHGGRVTADNTLANAEGTADLLTASIDGAWAKNADMGDVVFPASGVRGGNDGALASVGYYGHYWSGSARSATQGWYVGFLNNYVYSNDYSVRSFGFSVRCVRNTN